MSLASPLDERRTLRVRPSTLATWMSPSLSMAARFRVKVVLLQTEDVRQTMQGDSVGDTGRHQDGKLGATQAGRPQSPVIGSRYRPCGHPNFLTCAGCRRLLLGDGVLFLRHRFVYTLRPGRIVKREFRGGCLRKLSKEVVSFSCWFQWEDADTEY